jgi:chromosomal replication initiator protein
MVGVRMSEKILVELKDMLQKALSANEFDTWIKPIQFVNTDDEVLTLSVPTNFFLDFFEKNYLQQVSEKLNNLAGRIMRLNIVVVPSASESGVGSPDIQELLPSIVVHDKIDPFIRNHAIASHYTFDRFVVGDNNALAHAAACKVAKTPGSAYNPLFIYGGVGLGKTHLMHAVGNALLKKDVNLKIVYVTGEEFMNLFIESIQKKQQEKFRKRFRNLDVLLFDDVQFLIKKEQTMWELFHTFNELKKQNKQIIFTSDRTPEQLKVDGIDERLASRMGSKLTVEIIKPSLETRIAILKAKANEEKTLIPNDVFLMIANNIETDIRLLESALNRIIAEHKLRDKDITVDMVKSTLNHISAEKGSLNVSFEDIILAASNVFKLSIKEIKSKSRTTQINQTRQIVMFLARSYTQMSYKEIANEFGKEHPTIISGIKRIEGELKKNTRLKEKFDEVVENLKKAR